MSRYVVLDNNAGIIKISIFIRLFDKYYVDDILAICSLRKYDGQLQKNYQK